MKYVRAFALAAALAFLVVPAAPMGGIIPIPTVGGPAYASSDDCFEPEIFYWGLSGLFRKLVDALKCVSSPHPDTSPHY